MARMPGAEWQGEHGSSLMSGHDIVCVHTIVGYAPAHAAHFSVKADGTILQSRDTQYKSAANLEGNHRVIAIENEDHGSAFGDWNTSDGHAVPALTAAQVEANGQILRWAHETHDVPLYLCPDSRPGSRGLAYHRQGIDGNFNNYDYPGRVSGGEVWTSYPGKVCPGDARISQLPAILAAAMDTAPPEPPPVLEEDMFCLVRAPGRPDASVSPSSWRTCKNSEEAEVALLMADGNVCDLSARQYDVLRSMILNAAPANGTP